MFNEESGLGDTNRIGFVLNSDVHSDNGSSPDMSPKRIFVRVQNKEQKEPSILFKNDLLSVKIQQVVHPEKTE